MQRTFGQLICPSATDMEDDVTPKQSEDYRNALHRILSKDVRQRFIEIIAPRLLEANAGSSKMDNEMMAIIFSRTSNLISNMICSVALTTTKGNLTLASIVVRSMLSEINELTEETWRRRRDGELEVINTLNFNRNTGQPSPFGFSDHIAPADTPDSGRASDIGGEA